VYAVIDLETTGLHPHRHDRVVEVAVVHVDAAGKVVNEWCTLVNPERDLGPQHIHRIRAADVLDAPRFSDVAGHLAELLKGRVIVAHNLRFDARFLATEYELIGAKVPVDAHSGLCTMALADRYLPGAGRSLADCCTRAGVELTSAHSALHDARAAAGLLTYYLCREPEPPWAHLHQLAMTSVWPALSVKPVKPVLRRATAQASEHFLSRLVARLPRVDDQLADAYLDMLDRALLDRHLSHSETEALVDFATSVGLGRVQVVELHEAHVRTLAADALADGVLSAAERADLEKVTALLGLTPAHLDKALSDPAPPPRPKLTRFRLAPGDEVAFTGQLDSPREEWERHAAQHGLRPGAWVTKRTKLVVAADPDSQSTKARQARRYRIPIVDAETFLRLTEDLARCTKM